MAWHDLNSKSTETKAEYLARVKYKSIVVKSANSFMDIVGNELHEGIQYRIVTNNSFNAISVYEYLARSEEITEMYIAVYRMNQRAVLFLKDIIEQNKIQATIIVSSFFRENKKYERWAQELIAYAASSKLVKVVFRGTMQKSFAPKQHPGSTSFLKDPATFPTMPASNSIL